MGDKATIEKLMKATGVAGQVSYTATVKYEGEEASVVRFVGSTYGGPVVMVLPSGVQEFVTDPNRFGKFSAAWVREFFA